MYLLLKANQLQHLLSCCTENVLDDIHMELVSFSDALERISFNQSIDKASLEKANGYLDSLGLASTTKKRVLTLTSKGKLSSCEKLLGEHFTEYSRMLESLTHSEVTLEVKNINIPTYIPAERITPTANGDTESSLVTLSSLQVALINKVKNMLEELFGGKFESYSTPIAKLYTSCKARIANASNLTIWGRDVAKICNYSSVNTILQAQPTNTSQALADVENFKHHMSEDNYSLISTLNEMLFELGLSDNLDNPDNFLNYLKVSSDLGQLISKEDMQFIEAKGESSLIFKQHAERFIASYFINIFSEIHLEDLGTNLGVPTSDYEALMQLQELRELGFVGLWYDGEYMLDRVSSLFSFSLSKEQKKQILENPNIRFVLEVLHPLLIAETSNSGL